MRKLILLLILVAMTADATALNYYVATSGSDSNSGIQSAPFRTIQKCADTVSRGDTCLVSAGTYSEPQVNIRKGGSYESKVTFMADGNVIMKGFYIRNSSIVINGFNITGFKGMWTSFIHNKDVRNIKDIHILNNHIHDGTHLYLEDATLTSSGSITSNTGGFVNAGFETGDMILITCDKNSQDGETRDFSGRMIIDSVSNNIMNAHAAPNTQAPIDLIDTPCRLFINTYGISMDADGYVIVNNTLNNLWGNFVNMLGKNGLAENNHMFDINSWDVFRIFGENYLIRNNYVHDSDPMPFIGNHPDLFQNWGFETLDAVSRNVTVEKNFFAHMDTQICMFGPNWNHNPAYNNPGLTDWRLVNNVFYNITIQANTGMPKTNWSNNIFYHVGGTGGAGTVLSFSNLAVDALAYNNIFLATGGSMDSHGWYSQGGTGFYADYNYVANSPPAFRPKANRCPASYNFCEDHGINGGDPMMQNVDDPLGPDQIPFTSDDGLVPLSNSPLCNAGKGGLTIGAYECQGCTSNNPIAFFSYDKQSGYEPLDVVFDASKSLSCSPGPMTFSWDFGDGTSATGIKVNKTFSSGAKVVTLTVRNSQNQDASYTKNLNIFPALVPNLVLYLNLDGNLKDWSGRNHYTDWPGSKYIRSNEGEAAAFDGTTTGKGIAVRHQDDLDAMPKLTISFWAKKNIPTESNDVVQKHITYTVTLAPKGFSSYIMNTTTRFDIVATTANNDTLWHHYALTYDGSIVKLYFDGTEAASKPFSGSVARNPDRDLAIGKNVWGTAFDGAMDEFRIYDTSLSSTQIKNHYNISSSNSTAYKKGDLDQNWYVDVRDLTILLRDFGTVQLGNDLNSDSKIDIFDVMVIVKDWG